VDCESTHGTTTGCYREMLEAIWPCQAILLLRLGLSNTRD